MRKLSTAWQSPRLRYTLLAGILIAGFLLLLWRGGFFMAARLSLNDIYYVPAATTNSTVIIAVDDASLNRYGRTPAEWSRSVYAELADRLAQTNARVVSIDLLLSEPQDEDEAVAEAFANLRQNDARTRIVLADAGIDMAVESRQGELPEMPFTSALPLSAVIAARADYRGFTNTLPDVDSVVRRQPSLIRVNGETRFSFSIATYLAYLRIPSAAAQQVISVDDGHLLVTAERRIPVDEFGLWLPYFFGPPASATVTTYPIVSLVDVIDGEVDPALFDDRIVLVGLINNTGMLDQYQAPSSTSGSLMAGIEIQANAIESLLQSTFLAPLADGWQGAILVLLTVGASLVYALPRWYFKIVLAVLLGLLCFVLASVLFSMTHRVFNLFDMTLALALPLVASIGIDITLETLQRQQKEFLLNSMQRIAEQRLQLPQAAEYILEDMEKIAPGVAATLYVRDSDPANGCQRFRRGGESLSSLAVKEDPLLKRYQSSQSVVRENGLTVVPLLWQGKQQGMIALQHPHQSRLDHTAETLVRELADQLAPNIDNMLLYDQVQRQKSLLDAMFAESPAGIAIVDAEGRIVQCNQNLGLLLGSSQTAMHGRILSELIATKAEDQALAGRLSEGIRSNESFDIDEVTLGETSVRIDVAPLRAYDLWTVIVGDVTALVELSKLKTQMLRIASHDLKNPLARVMGFADLISMRVDLDEEDQRFLGFIQKASEEMLNIINDILNLERLRSGRVMLEDINLTQLVREVCASHQPDVIQKRQEFNLELPDKLIHVHADTGQLSQAITNLVGNAIKYTPDEGRITVRLTSAQNQVRFEVEDTGYGIPKEAQDKLFTEFYRAKAEATLHISGTGLGLSLVKSVIESHGGKIGFTSTEGVGSTFYFTLPGIEQNEAEQAV